MELYERKEHKSPDFENNVLFVAFSDDEDKLAIPELKYAKLVACDTFKDFVSLINSGNVVVIRDNRDWIERLRLIADHPGLAQCTVVYVDGVIDYMPTPTAESVINGLSRSSYLDWEEAKEKAEAEVRLAEEASLSPDELSRRVNMRANGTYKAPNIKVDDDDVMSAEDEPPSF